MKNARRESGQIIAEYAMMLVMVLAITAMLVFLMAVFSEYGWRMLVLTGWEPWS